MTIENPFNSPFGCCGGSGTGGGTPADYNQVKQAVSENTDKINALQDSVKTNADNIAENGDRIQANTNRINELNGGIQSNASNINILLENVATISGNVEDLQQADNALQAEINTNAGNIQTNSERINEMQADLTALSGSVADLRQSVENNTAGITANRTAIETNSDRIDTNAGNIQTNAENIATNRADIDALETVVENLQNRIDECCNSGTGGSGEDHNFTYQPLSSNQGVKLVGANSIDTGVPLYWDADIMARGCLQSLDNQAVLIGAYYSTGARCVVKFLPVSGKIQAQMPKNKEITNLQSLDFLKPFTTEIGRTYARIYQYGEDEYGEDIQTANLKIDFSITEFADFQETNFYLFNQTENGEFNNGILQSARILYKDDYALWHTINFQPYIKTYSDGRPSEVVMVKNEVIDKGIIKENITKELTHSGTLEVVTIE